jgi:hypothetical protein
MKLTWTSIETRSSRAQWGTSAQTLWRLSRAIISQAGSGKPSHEVHGRSRDRLHDDCEECRLQAESSCVTGRRLRIHFGVLPSGLLLATTHGPGTVTFQDTLTVLSNAAFAYTSIDGIRDVTTALNASSIRSLVSHRQ